MKKTISFLIVVLSFILLSFSFSGCSKHGYVINEKKTQIYVGNYYFGLRDRWLQDVKLRFEKSYEDVSFEEGKFGVEVVIDNGSYAAGNLLNHLKSSRDTVFFSESIDYYDWINEGVLADITDIVTEPLSEYGEERSIEDKMTEEFVNYFKVNDKYYGLPFYEGSACIAYNIDLFERNKLYLAKNGCPSERLQENGSFDNGYKFTDGLSSKLEKSAGPDGKYHTNDDGLPATYEEFYAMCTNMRNKGITPLIWPGAHQDYFNELAAALWINHEGKEQAMLNYTFDGTATDLVSVDGNGNITKLPELQINNKNGKELVKQEGRYYALDFVKHIISSDFYDTISVSGSQSNLDSQNDFLYGGFTPNKPQIAMLIDGSWWDSEANDTYELMASTYGPAAAKNNRRIGLLPLPWATEDKIGNKRTNIVLKNSLGFINAKAADTPIELELAKKFLQFAHTDESLIAFTKIQNMPKPYLYNMPEEDKSEMSYFGRDLFESHLQSDLVLPLSSNPLFLSSPTKFAPINSWNTRIGNITESLITDSFRNDPSLTSKRYFDGLYTQLSLTWDNDYSAYFN